MNKFINNFDVTIKRYVQISEMFQFGALLICVGGDVATYCWRKVDYKTLVVKREA